MFARKEGDVPDERPHRDEVLALIALLLVLYLIAKGTIMKTTLKILAVLFVAFILMASCLAALSAPDRRTADPPTSTTSSTTTTTTPTPDLDDAAPAPAGVGDEVRDGAFAFVVTDVQTGVPTIGEGVLAEQAQGTYTIVRVVVKNTDAQAQMFDGGAQKLLDALGREFSHDSGAAMSLPGSHSFLEMVNPGISFTATLVYDLPAGTTATAIELHDSPFSGGVRVALT
jgi:hypothetical protein